MLLGQLRRKMSSSIAGVAVGDKLIERSIVAKLTEALSPVHLEVVNESFKHNVPPGSESHFKVCVVSATFDGKSPIQRHRLVNTILDEELKGKGLLGATGTGTGTGIHALSIQAKTPAQWEADPQTISTPNCLGGSKA